jgi:acetyl esterase/lipase
MSYKLDPELAPIMAALAEQSADAPVPGRGDWRAVRATATAGLGYMATLVPPSAGVQTATHFVKAPDGAELELRWYTKEGSSPGSAVVYAHGGGMVAGSLDLYDEVVSWYVSETGVPFLSVQYRLAPEVGGTTLAEDVYAGLTWLIDHAEELGVDADRLAVMGDSGGGGPAAGAVILARNHGVPLARQILVYPMLDDRNIVPGPIPAALLTWTYDNNFTGWNAALGDERGTEAVSPVAAPARLTDLAGLAPAYIEVGDLDIFCDESISYAQQLARAGITIELHVHPGAPHGFERFAPATKLGQRAMHDRARAVASI